MEHNLIQVNQSLVNMYCWSTLMEQFIPGVTKHAHTPIYKNIISHALVQTFRQKKRCIRCQFQLQSLLCYYFLYLCDVPSPAKPPQEYFSRSRFFDRPKHKFAYKREFRKYRSHILYNNKGPEWKLPDQFKSLISLLPDTWNSLKSVRNFVENHSG